MADLIDLESELEHIAIGFNQLQNIPSMPEDSWPTTSSSTGTGGGGAATPDPFSGTSFNTSSLNSTTSNGFFNDPFGSSFTSPSPHHQPSLFGNQSAVAAPSATTNIWPTTPQVQTPQPMAYSSSNPFLNGASTTPSILQPSAPMVTTKQFPIFNPPLNHIGTVQPPQLPADPFDTQGLRQAITSIPQLSTLTLPPPPQPQQAAPTSFAPIIQPLQQSNGMNSMNNNNNFADFSVLNSNQ